MASDAGASGEAENKRQTDCEACMNTCYDAVHSKASCASKGYYKDPYSIAMSGRGQARSPLINRGYWARIKFVETLVADFLAMYKGSKKVNLVSLGAGMDSLYFRMADAGQLTGIAKFVEFDFDAIVRRKSMTVQMNKVFKTHLADEGNTWKFADKGFSCEATGRADYAVVTCNLAKTDSLEETLKNLNIDFTLPTLVLAECVLNYLPVPKSNALIQRVAKLFTGGAAMLIYEQIRPETRFGKVMVSNLTRRGLPVNSIRAFPSLEKQAKRYRDAGFTEAIAKDLNALYTTYIDQSEAFRVAKIEMFDEFEEWNLLMSHYCCCLAVKDPPPNTEGPRLSGKLGWLDPNRPVPKPFVPPKRNDLGTGKSVQGGPAGAPFDVKME